MKKILFPLIVVVLTVAILICILEVFFMQFTPYKANKRWNYSEEELGSTKFDGVELEGILNSKGLRDKEYAFKHNTYRILCIGDSFTYGLGLRNSDSWPKKAEKYLQDGGYDNLEILNGGISGFNTRKEYEFFNKYTYKFNPDMVIIGFLINDATTLSSNYGAVALKQEFDKLIERTKNKFGLYTLNYIKLTAFQRKLTKATIKEYSDPYEKESNEFQQCKKAFLNFRKISRKNNFKLIVVIYPMLCQLNENYPFKEIHKKMMVFFKRSGIEAYDLTPAFYGYKDTELWISSEDSHPNIRANEIAAKKIVSIIKKHL